VVLALGEKARGGREDGTGTGIRSSHLRRLWYRRWSSAFLHIYTELCIARSRKTMRPVVIHLMTPQSGAIITQSDIDYWSAPESSYAPWGSILTFYCRERIEFCQERLSEMRQCWSLVVLIILDHPMKDHRLESVQSNVR
jgi:hypothetical protein